MAAELLFFFMGVGLAAGGWPLYVRHVRAVGFLFGFIFGGIFGGLFWGITEPLLGVLIFGLVGGYFGWNIAMEAMKAFFMLIGGLMGAILSFVLGLALFGFDFSLSLFLFLLLLLAPAGAMLVWIYHKWGIITSTAIIGAGLAAIALQSLPVFFLVLITGIGVQAGVTSSLISDEDYHHTSDGKPDLDDMWIVDRTGEDSVTVKVGADEGLLFSPAAIRIDAGSTVTWEWTGKGGYHDVVATDGSFSSGEPTDEKGFIYEVEFKKPRIYEYVCTQHESAGMKGAIIVE